MNSILTYLVIAIVIGIIISFVVTGSKKAALTSVHFESQADNYTKEKHITKRKDVYLYKTLEKTEKPKQESNEKK